MPSFGNTRVRFLLAGQGEGRQDTTILDSTLLEFFSRAAFETLANEAAAAAEGAATSPASSAINTTSDSNSARKKKVILKYFRPCSQHRGRGDGPGLAPSWAVLASPTDFTRAIENCAEAGSEIIDIKAFAVTDQQAIPPERLVVPVSSSPASIDKASSRGRAAVGVDKIRKRKPPPPQHPTPRPPPQIPSKSAALGKESNVNRTSGGGNSGRQDPPKRPRMGHGEDSRLHSNVTPSPPSTSPMVNRNGIPRDNRSARPPQPSKPKPPIFHTTSASVGSTGLSVGPGLSA